MIPVTLRISSRDVTNGFTVTDRVADLTWRRPKAVLVALAVFVVVAAILGRGVEEHLKAAGFTDSASECGAGDRAPSRRVRLRRESGPRRAGPRPGLQVARHRRARRARGGQSPAGSSATWTSSAARSTRSARWTWGAQIRRAHVEISRHEALRPQGRRPEASAGHGQSPRVEPHRRRGAARAAARGGAGEGRETCQKSPLIADDGRSSSWPRHLSTQDCRRPKRRRCRGRDGQRLSRSLFEVGIGGFTPELQPSNDQTRDDLTKAELISFPLLAIMLLVVFSGVIAALIPLRDRRDFDPRHPVRAPDHGRAASTPRCSRSTSRPR